MLLEKTSATNVKLFILCKRRWHLETVGGLKPPPTAAMQNGTDLHGELEVYLKTGAVPQGKPTSFLAAKGIPLLPKPGPGLLVENWLENPTLAVKVGSSLVKWNGRIDFIDPRDPGVLLVGDHKTTSAWKWMKTPEDLCNDAQMVSYALWALARVRGVTPDEVIADIEKGRLETFPTVRLQHIYYLTRGSAAAKVVNANLDVDIIPTVWSQMTKTVEEMCEVAQEEDSYVVDPNNFINCNAYGGCPHKNRCGITPERSLTSVLFGRLKSNKPEGSPKMSLLADRMKNAQKSASTPAPAPVAPAAKEEAKPAPAEAKPVVTKTQNADGTTTHSATTPSGTKVSVTDVPADTKPAAAAAPASSGGGLAARLKAAKPAAAATTSTPAVSEGVKPPDAPKTEQAEPPKEEAKPAAEPKRRGRPPKAKAAEGSASAAAPAAEAPAAPSTGNVSADDGPTPDELDLFIDCMPVKGLEFGKVTHLSALVDEVAQKIASEEDPPLIDIRMIDFMKWKGLLAAYFRQNPPKGVVYADSRSDLVQPVIDVLVPLARSVFRRV